MAVARRRLIDTARRRRVRRDAAIHLGLIAEELGEPPTTGMAIPDNSLALMFACAHPAIDPAIRAPLILQTILGFDAAAIASAFLISPGGTIVWSKPVICEPVRWAEATRGVQASPGAAKRGRLLHWTGTQTTDLAFAVRYGP